MKIRTAERLERWLLVVACFIMVAQEGLVAYRVLRFMVNRNVLSAEHKLRQINAFTQEMRQRKKIVFLGDSITARWDLARLSFLPFAVRINRGVPSDTTKQIWARFNASVLAFHPNTVLILAGINDVANHFPPEVTEANYVQMVQAARSAGVQVYLGTVMPARENPQPGAYYSDAYNRISVLNRWILDYCQKDECVVVDFGKALGGHFDPSLFIDDVHPNVRGLSADGKRNQSGDWCRE